MYSRGFSRGVCDVSLAGGQRLVKLSEWITEIMQHGDKRKFVRLLFCLLVFLP